MLNIIFDTHKAISTAKTKKSMNKTLLVLLVASVLFGASVLFVAKDTEFIMPALGVVAFFFIFTLIIAFFSKLSLQILTKKGGYYEVLTATSYGCFVMASGAFIASILNLLSGLHVVLTGIVAVVGGLILLASIILAKTIKMRATMEFFSTDLITVLFGYCIVYISIFVAVYIMTFQIMFGLLGTIDPSVFGTNMPMNGFENLDLYQ